ncbi:MAG: RHS repeat-associated core domain-containing protein [Bryobacteraceae bacterium]
MPYRRAWIKPPFYYGGKCTTLGPPRTGCDLIQESYKYNAAGNMLGKRVKLTRGSATGTLTASFTYDNEGRPTQVQYPAWTCSGCSQVVGSKYNFAYDTLGRLNTMTNGYTSASVISGVTYGVANEIQAISGILNETRQYSSTFQLTRITVPSVLDIQYAYPSAGSNNGKLASQTDVLSGEQVVYTYDSLNRLATAQTADNPSVTQWGQSYTYDGFGNLTDQDVIKGSVPTMHVVYSASTNRQTGDTADLNGNIGSGYLYDIENRLLRPGASSTVQYGYDAGNKRVWRGDTGVDEFAFFAGNQKLATYTLAVSGTSVRHQLTSTNVYFGGRMIAKGAYNSGGTNDKVTLTSIAQDRLGSMNGKFYPYGQERPSATSNDKEKFTGYYRDASTGLDYADQRYHQAGVGRFMTPDPFGGSAKANDPGSWNRYAYVAGDPVNRRDPRGLNPFDPPEVDPCVQNYSLGCVAPNPREAPFAPEPWDAWGDPYNKDGYTCEQNFGADACSTNDLQWAAIFGQRVARSLLGKETCAKHFGFESGVSAQAAFDKISFSVSNTMGKLQIVNTPEGGKQIADRSPSIAQTTDSRHVEINGLFGLTFSEVAADNLSTGEPDTFDFLKGVNDVLGTRMTSTELMQLVMLHEFGHAQAGYPQESQAEFGTYNGGIFNDCMR